MTDDFVTRLADYEFWCGFLVGMGAALILSVALVLFLNVLCAMRKW